MANLLSFIRSILSLAKFPSVKDLMHRYLILWIDVLVGICHEVKVKFLCSWRYVQFFPLKKCLFYCPNLSFQAHGEMRCGQTTGLQWRRMGSFLPSLSIHSLWQRRAVRFSLDVERKMANPTLWTKCHDAAMFPSNKDLFTHQWPVIYCVCCCFF